MADDLSAITKQVKEANDIVDVVGGYVTLRPAGPTFKGLCPFHEDHRPSFDVDPRRQRYRCWSCGKHGDVIMFIQEHDRVGFMEALELLARRAGITLKKIGKSQQNSGRARMLEVVRWAAQEFHKCLLASPLAESARKYVAERKLSDDTVRRFELGFAPAAGDWLLSRSAPAGVSLDMLESVGLIARRQEGNGYYDRFRDRLMFPIRDGRGQTLGFGGRILPSSPLSERAPKYYNSAETALFTKSEQLYGLDAARQAGAKAGYLAVVEGYTDVLMAHQMGVPQVVSTMGTALNARHVQHLRRHVPAGKVVLVFDADAGGDVGVDRALEVFLSQEVDLAIATLPEGMDPCDLLVKEGPEPFQEALAKAVDALEFKIQRVLSAEAPGGSAGIEGRRRAVDAILRVLALAPEMPGQAGAIKRQLAVSRIAQRLALSEETVWARLHELRGQRRPTAAVNGGAGEEKRQAPAAPRERELVQLLLADPGLVPAAAAEVAPEHIEHPGLRRIVQGLYDLHRQGQSPDLDHLRAHIDNPRLVEFALGQQEIGRHNPDRPAWLRQILERFRQHRIEPQKRELQNQLHAASDHTDAVELLRRLQNRMRGF